MKLRENGCNMHLLSHPDMCLLIRSGCWRTCWLLPRREADGLLQEAELRVVQPEGLVHHVGRRLHVHLQDGHRFAVLSFKHDLRGSERVKGLLGTKNIYLY